MKNSIIGIGLGICVSLGLAGALSYFKLDNKVNVISNNTATPDCLVKSMTVYDNNGNIESITSNFIDVKEKYELEDIVEVVETDAEVLEPEEEVIEPEEEVVEPEEEVIVPDEEVGEPDEEVIVPDEEVIVPEEEGIVPEEFVY
jgi:hypothetical protein